MLYQVLPLFPTPRLCLCKQSIDLLPQSQMKTKLYNPGGTNCARLAERMDSVLQRRKVYPASEKLQILSSVDILMKSENMNQGKAAVMLQVCSSQVSRWRARAADLAAAVDSGRKSLQLHKGPMGLLDEVEEELFGFVDEWRSKGLPVSCLASLSCEKGLSVESCVCRQDSLCARWLFLALWQETILRTACRCMQRSAHPKR